MSQQKFIPEEFNQYLGELSDVKKIIECLTPSFTGHPLKRQYLGYKLGRNCGILVEVSLRFRGTDGLDDVGFRECFLLGQQQTEQKKQRICVLNRS